MAAIPVIARLRPPPNRAGQDHTVKCTGDSIKVGEKSYPIIGIESDVSTEKLYSDHLISTILQGVARGIDVGVVSMGQINSGKTFSLASEHGIVSMATGSLFQSVEGSPSFVGVSYINIYREKLTDLLNPVDNKEIKIKSHPDYGQYFENLSEIHASSKGDLLRLYEQGNKVRKILDIEKGIPSPKSHTILKIACEHKTKQSHQLVRSQLYFFDIASLDHLTDDGVSNSLHSLQDLVSENRIKQGTARSKLTMIMKPLLEAPCYFAVIGHITQDKTSLERSTQVMDLLLKFKQLDRVEPKSRTLDLPQLIAGLRGRVAISRNAVMSHNSEKPPKEAIAELEGNIATLSAVKRLQWSEREKASDLAEEERRHTLADKGILEWVTERASSSSVLLLQREKDGLLAQYKAQRKVVDSLKKELQTMIETHSSLSGEQSDEVLQGSLAGIHSHRDQLKGASDKLRELKSLVKSTQEKLKDERNSGNNGEVGGNFGAMLSMKRDELSHIRRDNDLFLEEEKERMQGEADLEIAELRQSTSTLSMQQCLELREESVKLRAQLNLLSLRVQCLETERGKLSEAVDELESAHQKESEVVRARNLLTFRRFKDYHEEFTGDITSRYQKLVNACVQDSVFLSSQNSQLSEENAELKKKLKHFR